MGQMEMVGKMVNVIKNDEDCELDINTSYIYGLFDGEEQIDQTSLDEMNENLAWEIMVDDENRNPKGLSVCLIDEVQE
jgi:hypothetical protein